MRSTLICTIGTSLLNNLKRSEEEPIKQAVAGENWNQLSLLLLDKENTDRLCGAEINSIARICEKGFLANLRRLIFLVSETPDGKKTGDLLKLYYEKNHNPLKFDRVEMRVLSGLRDDNVKDFKQQGLKNLVREISTEVNKFGPETIAINATGGYKAQISFAGMIGQALEIPVYYLFEKFSEVIELPPQPVALDLEFWLNNYSLFEQLEREPTLEKSKLEGSPDNKYWSSLIEEVVVNDIPLVSLSAMGVLFNERSRLQFAKQERAIMAIIPQDETPAERKNIKLSGDHHGNDVLHNFAKKIRQSPYVKEIIKSLEYHPKRKNPILDIKDNGIVEFVLTWTDAGYGLCIQTTGRNKAETTSIALHLKEKFAE